MYNSIFNWVLPKQAEEKTELGYNKVYKLRITHLNSVSSGIPGSEPFCIPTVKIMHYKQFLKGFKSTYLDIKLWG